MLETFCASVNFRSTLLQCKSIPAVDKYLEVFNDATKDRSGNELMDLGNSQTKSHASSTSKEPLSERATKALRLRYMELYQSPLPSYTLHSKHVVGSVSFTTRVGSKRDCNVIFRSLDESVPGVIQFIVSIAEQGTSKVSVFFLIERHAPLPPNTIINPFSDHVAFGASLWSSKMEDKLQAVPASAIVCHSVSQPWVNGVVLIKELNRVCVHVHFFPPRLTRSPAVLLASFHTLIVRRLC